MRCKLVHPLPGWCGDLTRGHHGGDFRLEDPWAEARLKDPGVGSWSLLSSLAAARPGGTDEVQVGPPFARVVRGPNQRSPRRRLQAGGSLGGSAPEGPGGRKLVSTLLSCCGQARRDR